MSTTTQEKDTIPRVQHVLYFQAALKGIAEGLTFDGVRARIRVVSNEVSRRPGSTSSRVADAYTLWSPTADAISELMRLGLVERRSLPSKRLHVDAHRDTTYTLTTSGEEIIKQSRGDDASFRGALTPLLIKQHPYLSALCASLAEEPLVIPEYTEEELKEFKRTSDLWTSKLGEDAAEHMKRTMKLAKASTETVTRQIHEWLARRFPIGAEPTTKDVLDTVHDALVVAALEARGLHYDATTFNVLTSWGRQLSIIDESRYVQGVQGRVIWGTASVDMTEGKVSVERRGLSKYGDRIAEQLPLAYREVADAIAVEIGGSYVRYPYIEIYKVRALTAYRLGVNIPLVDRVIAEIAGRIRKAPYRIELQLGMSDWVLSEPPFRLGSRRYYVILIKPEGEDHE
jgi:hypothetical protein